VLGLETSSAAAAAVFGTAWVLLITAAADYVDVPDGRPSAPAAPEGPGGHEAVCGALVACRSAPSTSAGELDTLFDEFEQAWTCVRAAVELADRGGADPSRDALAAIVDRAIRTRTRARIAAARAHGGNHWGGDQALFEREVKVGALARELAGFATSWPPGGGGMTRDELLSAVRPLLVTPGEVTAQTPPW
jgi:hypothetical protein